MYINDLPDKITQGETYLYADDTTFYYAVKNIEEVVDKLNMIGKKVNDWCQENQLMIHTGKSEVLIITNRNFVGPLRPVRIGDEIIQYVKTTSLLGIELDNKLTWNTQVKKVIKSYCAKVLQLKRMSYLPIHVQEEIYFKTIIAAISYGMIVWWTCSSAHTADLERIHVRAARIIHRLPRDIPDEEILRLAKWDRLDYIYKRMILSIMHKVYQQTAPEALERHFSRKLTRSRDNLSFELPRCSREIGRTSVRWRGPLLWNTLPINLRSIKGKDTFKNQLKSMKEHLNAVSFNKEACLIQKKQRDFIYY
eukprot:Seg1000.5 transcript_id=Seg1000.5/GoldUCD/mRNA.D3Y31 product="putative RNA-directed DNA polymerase from transposon BS" pseudo=true protein_id=Seg1000.5/GoldUCD/D3Y31